MKKLFSLVLCLVFCFGLVTISSAQARYTDLESFSASAKRTSSTEIFCSAILGAYKNQDLEIQVVVTDSSGNEVDSRFVSAYDNYLELEEYVDVPVKGTYTCKFFFPVDRIRPL